MGIKVEKSTAVPNFLDTPVGLVCKTRQIPQSMGVAEGNFKIVHAGTAFPADDATATGIVYQDADVTDGDAPGSVMLAGRVLKDRLTISDTAFAALAGLGIVFVDENGDTVKPTASELAGS